MIITALFAIQAVHDDRQPQGTSNLSGHVGGHADQGRYRTGPGGVPGPGAPVPFGTAGRRLGRAGRLEGRTVGRRETEDGLRQNILPQVSTTHTNNGNR